MQANLSTLESLLADYGHSAARSPMAVFNGQAERTEMRRLCSGTLTSEIALKIVWMLIRERQEWGNIDLNRVALDKLSPEKEQAFQDYRELEKALQNRPEISSILDLVYGNLQSPQKTTVEGIFGEAMDT